VTLSLNNINLSVDGEVYLSNVTANFETGEFNTLLGPTLSGKTSLLRILAGLDAPDEGTVTFNDTDITNVSAKKRNVAFVYQQFINYPSFSVFDNIASPLKVAGVSKSEINDRVEKISSLLKIDTMLSRKPSELSGGQQQRVALARALVRNADIILLDEPLGNLDYKLREELRLELPKLFKETNSIVVYATTEPEEALMLGGNVTLLSEGKVIQRGPTMDVYKHPKNIQSALTFSDPPINICDEKLLDIGAASTIGIRPHHIKLVRTDTTDIEVTAQVTLSEITGSETFVHAAALDQQWTTAIHGVHHFNNGDTISLYLNPANFVLFDTKGEAVAAPKSEGF
jgi:glycerol transport system ATP-binding protein